MWFYQAIHRVLPLPKSLAEKVTHFCIDSRNVVPGSLFFALKGEKVDGHEYLNQAYQKGAVCAVVSDREYIKKTPLPLLVVNNVQACLQSCAKRVICNWKPKIIGITGSLGKTSTKEFLRDLIDADLEVHCTPGNYNTQLTLPLTILNSPKKTPFLILEMGLDHPGEIDRLMDIAPPNYSILTMIAHVHVEFFKSFEALAHEKMKIVEQAKDLAIYNADMPFSKEAAQKGLSPKKSYSLKDFKADYFMCLEDSSFKVYESQKLILSAPSPFIDEKSHYNLLAAIVMARQLNIDLEKIKIRLPKLKHEKNRLQVINKNGLTLLLDAYNSNLDSAVNALLCLKTQFSGRKIAVLSEMVEQGMYGVENHRKLIDYAIAHADVIIGFGPMMHLMSKACRKSRKKWAFFLSYPNMLVYLSKLLKKGDILLLKGSRKFALERISNDLNIC